jgi:hypothetical protein
MKPDTSLGADIEAAGAKIVSVGSCNISIVVNTGNATITGCNDVDSPEFRERLLDWFRSTEYGKSLRDLQTQSQQLQELTAEANALDASKEATAKRVADISKDVHALREQQNRDKIRLGELTEGLVDSARQEFHDATVYQQTAIDTLDREVLENMAQTSAVNEQLADVNARIDKLQSDVQLVMHEFLEGRLDKTLIFAGASVGALLNESQGNPRYGVEAELLTPSFKRIAVLTELGHIDWTLRSHYSTLAGLPPESFDIDRSRTYFGIGLLCITPLEYHDLRVDVGGLVGKSQGEGASGVTGTALLRTEWARRSLLVSIDVRGDYFAAVPDETRVFNPLGNATIRDSSPSVLVPSVELRFAMRIR